MWCKKSKCFRGIQSFARIQLLRAEAFWPVWCRLLLAVAAWNVVVLASPASWVHLCIKAAAKSKQTKTYWIILTVIDPCHWNVLPPKPCHLPRSVKRCIMGPLRCFIMWDLWNKTSKYVKACQGHTAWHIATYCHMFCHLSWYVAHLIILIWCHVLHRCIYVAGKAEDRWPRGCQPSPRFLRHLGSDCCQQLGWIQVQTLGISVTIDAGWLLGACWRYWYHMISNNALMKLISSNYITLHLQYILLY